MPLASTSLAPFGFISKVLHAPASTQTNVYTSQLLHKHPFTPSTFCRNLHQAASTQTRFYTNSLFHKPPFTPTSSYTNELLHASVSTQTSQTNFSTNQLSHKQRFAPTNFYKPAFTQISFYTNQLYTNQLLDKPPFTICKCKPPFTPTSFTQPRLWACWPKARGPAECRRLLNTCLSIHLCTYMFIPAESFIGFTTWSKYVNIVVSLQWQDAFCPQNVITKNIRCFWRGQPFLHFLFKTTLVLLCQLSSWRAWAVCSRRLCWLLYFMFPMPLEGADVFEQAFVHSSSFAIQQGTLA